MAFFLTEATTNKLFIVAEMSCNHAGSIENAFELIRAAKWAGADAVKIQTYTPDCMTLKVDRPEFYYQGKTEEWKGKHLYELYAECQTPLDWHEKLFAYAKKQDILLFSSPFSPAMVDFLETLDCPLYKIASNEANYDQLIDAVVKTGKPIIVSAGASCPDDLFELRKKIPQNAAILHCVSEYPSTIENCYLMRLKEINLFFGGDTLVGLSDHSEDILIPMVAVGMGAKIIEKHLKVPTARNTADTHFSLNPIQFKMMVDQCRKLYKSMYNIDDYLDTVENAQKLSRSIYVSENIKRGDVFTEQNLAVVRPGNGLSPSELNTAIGRAATRDLERGTPLHISHIAKL